MGINLKMQFHKHPARRSLPDKSMNCQPAPLRQPL